MIFGYLWFIVPGTFGKIWFARSAFFGEKVENKSFWFSWLQVMDKHQIICSNKEIYFSQQMIGREKKSKTFIDTICDNGLRIKYHWNSVLIAEWIFFYKTYKDAFFALYEIVI